MTFNAEKIYKKLKKSPTKYIEKTHCPLILQTMYDKNKGTISSFCSQVLISETTFYKWCKEYPLFMQCYSLGKMMTRENWEQEGRSLKDNTTPIGTVDHSFEYWRMIGWSRFGVGKNSRIRLDLNPADNPNQHYNQLLSQAAQGDFTAGEIKQLMEAVNVGLNAHQVFTLQAEIDELKSDLIKMQENLNVKNTSSN